jgi:hypothetical protein
MKANILYVAGPMSHIPQYNVPAFLDAEKDLLARGKKVVLPVDLNRPEEVAKLMACPLGTESATGRTWEELLSEDLLLIHKEGVEAICVLPGWQRSRGARLETFYGRLRNLEIVHYPSLRAVAAKDIQVAHGVPLGVTNY